ncbi:dual specificity protein kinase TTK isoform X2 [Anthonomus grandis grandis]|uniref:dual specificity protein kinase TTK isoform X2 n=1 Tax=Anthonomus grandis grandis TaxID=2921223 RepID=UPI0021663EC8|nr:dual specificity protein kinase TTK isoform X2 [Anthonomus grandis grandis]
MSTSKWRDIVPGRKRFNLTPLNLEAIRNEMQDSSYSEESEAEDDTSEHAILNRSFSDQTSPKPTEVTNKTEEVDGNYSSKREEDLSKEGVNEKEGSHSQDIFTSLNGIHANKSVSKNTPVRFEKPSQRQLSHFLETVPENAIKYSAQKTNLSIKNKENMCISTEPLNKSKDKSKNDSFDLDFSALSLHTPIKKKEKLFNYVTPKINIIPTSVNKSERPSMFKTPMNKGHFSKPLFKTPINKPLVTTTIYSGKAAPVYTARGTPGGNQSSILSELSDSQRIAQPKPVIYSSEDRFNRICVNNIEYVILKMLGKGGSSEVFYGFNKEEHLDVAIKLVSLADHNTAEGYVNEVKLLETLQDCDRIIKLYDYEIRDEKLLIVLEKSGEDLSSILKQLAVKESQLPTHMLLFYWMEMLYAVKQIHSKGVIHSDLKPANFLRSEGGLKLIDFGIASKVQDGMTCVFKHSQEGSCNYISPEALSHQTSGNVDSPNYGKPKFKVHFKSDVWSLGCILYQLVYRITPFQHISQMWAKLAAITNPDHKIKFPQNQTVSPRILNTIKRCLRYDTKARPSVDELILEYEELLKIIGNCDSY